MKTVLTLVAVGLFTMLVAAQNQPGTLQNDPWMPQLSTNAPPKGFATRIDYLKSFTSDKEIMDARNKGLINEDEAMLALEALDSKMKSRPMDTHGKVVDQDGRPIADVQVQSHLEVGIGSYDELDTKTDAQGLFSYTGHRGLALIMHFQKSGYEFNERLLPERPKDYLPDPTNPLIITMWKQRGAEPMTHKILHAYIPCDGSVTRFDLLTGKKNPDGDLFVSLTRKPLNIERRKPFDWTLTLQITNGGFQAITNIYPNEAPSDGYQSSMIFHYESGSSNWTSQIQPQLYFKGENGKVYGRMTLKVMADFQPPPTLFDAEIYSNPNGSRNLEFDPSKQIR